MAGREQQYWDTRCSYCEAPLRRDGGCSMWHGEPHDLPYGERQDQELEGLEGTVVGQDGEVQRYPDTPGPPPPPPAGPRPRAATPRGELLKALKGGPK